MSLEKDQLLRQQTLEERLLRAKKDRERREKALENSVPFISPQVDGLNLGKGFNLICAQPGQSKSTTAANIIAGALENTKTNVLVMSNEETSSAVYDRVACIITKTPFYKFFNGRLPSKDMQAVWTEADRIAERVEVYDFESRLSMGVLEDVQRVLSWAPAHYGLIIFDYLQNVTSSRDNPELPTLDISKRLGFFLKEISQGLTVPLVVFAQLRPRSENTKDLADRIQNDRTIYNHALLAVEIVPDFETQETTFKVHKQRFGSMQGKEFKMLFRNGWYEVEGDIL